MPGRSPAMTAMTAATLDQLSDGRMLLGIGSSGPQVSEGWHGVRFAKQLARTREYIAVVRMALARERARVPRRALSTCRCPTGPGKALKLTIAPVQERIPIYLAAIGPKNTALAGEIADGWIPTLLSPEHLPELRESLDEGAAKAGRSLDGFDIAPTVQRVRRPTTSAGARDSMRPFIALYVGGMGSREQELLQPARAALRLRGRGARDPGPLPGGQEGRGDGGAARRAHRPRVALRARATSCATGCAAYRDAGVGTLGDHADWRATKEGRLEQLRLVAELAG